MRNSIFITAVIIALSVCEMRVFSEESLESMVDDFMKRYPTPHFSMMHVTQKDNHIRTSCAYIIFLSRMIALDLIHHQRRLAKDL